MNLLASPRLCLSENRLLRTSILCLLYFAQGFPWGFATVALLSALSEAGHPKLKTATLTAMAILPWTFKFLWAPMIDTFRLPALGLRRPWIALAQLGMAVTLLGVWFTGDLGQGATLSYLAWVFFVHNCFASLQDVATDALAIDLLDDRERGRVNGLMWASKLLGTAAGGAGLGAVIARWNLQAAVLVQGLAVLAILGVVIAVRERTGERWFAWWREEGCQALLEVQRIPGGVFGVGRELLRALAPRTAHLAVLMALTVPLCEGLYVPLTTELFVQGFGWTAEYFSRMQGTLGVCGELVGALLGGFLCDRLGRRRMAALGMVLTSGVLLSFAFSSAQWTSEAYPRALLLPLFKGSFAFTTVSLFSLYMNISWTRAAATQFTLYMAVNNMGHALGARLNSINEWLEIGARSGWTMLDGVRLSNADHYVMAGCAALLPLTVLGFLRPQGIVERKLVESTMASSAPGM